MEYLNEINAYHRQAMIRDFPEPEPEKAALVAAIKKRKNLLPKGNK